MPSRKTKESAKNKLDKARKIAAELKSINSEFDISRNKADQLFLAGALALFDAEHVKK